MHCSWNFFPDLNQNGCEIVQATVTLNYFVIVHVDVRLGIITLYAYRCAHAAVLYAGALRWYVCEKHGQALSHAFSARVDCCAMRFSSMAMLKQSNWSACRYIRNDLGPSGTKYVLLFGECRYSRCRYTRRILCGSKWRKALGKKSTSV